MKYYYTSIWDRLWDYAKVLFWGLAILAAITLMVLNNITEVQYYKATYNAAQRINQQR